jgi:hypothetical protein
MHPYRQAQNSGDWPDTFPMLHWYMNANDVSDIMIAAHIAVERRRVHV